MSDTVAEILVDKPGAFGVEQVFGIPGDAIDACKRLADMKEAFAGLTGHAK